MAKSRGMIRNMNLDDDDASSSSRRKRTMTFDNRDVAPWSDLNHHVLFLVMMKLGVVDFVAFSGVCKSWRSLALSNKNKFIASMPPMSMWISTDSDKKDSYCYLEECEGRRFKTILPHYSAGRTCFGLTCGYVILFSRETRDFWLVNPITRHELHFPDYPLYVGVSRERVKGILVFSPLISGWVFVIQYKKISFYIAGKRRWNHVSSTIPIVDIHIFKGKIYTLHTDCSLGELRFDLKRNRKWTLHEIKNLPNPNLIRPFLVSSGENLYVIDGFKVLELDFSEIKWLSPEKTIGEYAFFISKLNHSAAIKPESWAVPRTQYKCYDFFLDTDRSQADMFYYEWIWYFPNDCFNVDLLDE